MTEQNSETVALVVEGMNCANCASGIEKKLTQLGCADVRVNFASSVASFRLPASLSRDGAAKAIEGMGFSIAGGVGEPLHHHDDGLTWKFWTALCFNAPLFAMHVGLDWHWLHHPYVQLALTTPVVLIAWSQFGRSAVRSIKNGVANMDVLVMLGILASYGYSLYGVLAGLGMEALYFESAATITTLVLLGNILEHRSVATAASAIAALDTLQPATAKRVGADGTAQEIPAAQIGVGDYLQVNTGDRIPTDGVVERGDGFIDESIVTGESQPVERRANEAVIGGTLVVQGSLVLRATAIGQGTVLANIIRLVNEAQTNKPQIQRLGDAVSAVFVPVVLGLSILTFLVNFLGFTIPLGESLLRAVAVLVIACPCAMGLATPTAVMVGIGRAARSGILFRGGSTLEEFARVKRVIFDKTGTLTDGQFTLRDVTVRAGESKQELLGIVKTLEQQSSHPIARSLVRELSAVPAAALHSISETRGTGMNGVDSGGRRYTLGRAGETAGALQGDLVLARDGIELMGLSIGDVVRPSAAEAIAALTKTGTQVALLSGDRSAVCAATAASLGIAEVYAEHRPEQKLARIQELEVQGPVAFVGDGVNDAPSLAGAAVGISIGQATEAAVASARVVILGGDLRQVPQALALARATLRTIKQNLFWAFSYNVLAIPLAAAGFLSPTLAALAMGFSDVMLIANSVWLRFRKLA